MEIRFNGHLVSFVVNYNFLFYYFPEFSGKTPFIANAIQHMIRMARLRVGRLVTTSSL